MAKSNLQPPKGFRDFYPDNLAVRNWLINKMEEVSQRYGYQKYEGPSLEPLELYAKKSGEDLVKKQTFILKDRSDKTLALRPELTPTLARMVSNKKQEFTFPLRWYSIGNRWRYEKPQKGRFREFLQWDIDLIGLNNLKADAEIITIAVEFLKSLGLSSKEVVVKINSRKFLEEKLKKINIEDKKIKEVFKAIDKKDKMDKKDWLKYLEEIKLNEKQTNEILKILQEKDFSKSQELKELFENLKKYKVEDYVEFDPTVVRGLDYYTGAVFEACDRNKEFRAILGGGRYDNLLDIIGGEKELSGIGFAAGDAVILELLEKLNKTPQDLKNNTQVLVTLFGDSLYGECLEIVKKLQNKNIKTEFYLTPDKLDKQLKYADKKNIPFVIILGPNEIKKKEVTIKNLLTREQSTVSLDKVDQFLLPALK